MLNKLIFRTFPFFIIIFNIFVSGKRGSIHLKMVSLLYGLICLISTFSRYVSVVFYLSAYIRWIILSPKDYYCLRQYTSVGKWCKIGYMRLKQSQMEINEVLNCFQHKDRVLTGLDILLAKIFGHAGFLSCQKRFFYSVICLLRYKNGSGWADDSLYILRTDRSFCFPMVVNPYGCVS